MLNNREKTTKKGLILFIILSLSFWIIISNSISSFTSSYSLSQIVSTFLFVLSGGYLPLVEAFISNADTDVSIKFGYPFVVSALCLVWVYPFSKTKNYLWLIPSSLIWLSSGWLYLGSRLT